MSWSQCNENRSDQLKSSLAVPQEESLMRNIYIYTYIPIRKDKRGNITASANYRGIALSSVIIKTLHLIVLTTRYSVKVSTSDKYI